VARDLIPQAVNHDGGFTWVISRDNYLQPNCKPTHEGTDKENGKSRVVAKYTVGGSFTQARQNDHAISRSSRMLARAARALPRPRPLLLAETGVWALFASLLHVRALAASSLDADHMLTDDAADDVDDLSTECARQQSE